MNIYELTTRRAYDIITVPLVCMYVVNIIHKDTAAILTFRFLLLWLDCAFLYYPHNSFVFVRFYMSVLYAPQQPAICSVNNIFALI